MTGFSTVNGQQSEIYINPGSMEKNYGQFIN
jgi:hypothetical protein